MMPQFAPGVPARMACGGYSVQPAPVGPPGHEEARHQEQHGEQVDPVAHHVDVREHHVAGAHHQRDQVVAETSQEQRGEQVDHHDHAVHGDVLQVGRRRDERERVRETRAAAA